MTDSNTTANPETPTWATIVPVPRGVATLEFTLSEPDFRQVWTDTLKVKPFTYHLHLLRAIAMLFGPLLTLMALSWWVFDWRYGGPLFGAAALVLVVLCMGLTRVTLAAERRSNLRGWLERRPETNTQRVVIFPEFYCVTDGLGQYANSWRQSTPLRSEHAIYVTHPESSCLVLPRRAFVHQLEFLDVAEQIESSIRTSDDAHHARQTKCVRWLSGPDQIETAEYRLTDADLFMYGRKCEEADPSDPFVILKTIASAALCESPFVGVLACLWFVTNWSYSGPWFGAVALIAIYMLKLWVIVPLFFHARATAIREWNAKPAEAQWQRFALFPQGYSLADQDNQWIWNWRVTSLDLANDALYVYGDHNPIIVPAHAFRSYDAFLNFGAQAQRYLEAAENDCVVAELA